MSWESHKVEWWCSFAFLPKHYAYSIALYLMHWFCLFSEYCFGSGENQNIAARWSPPENYKKWVQVGWWVSRLFAMCCLLVDIITPFILCLLRRVAVLEDKQGRLIQSPGPGGSRNAKQGLIPTKGLSKEDLTNAERLQMLKEDTNEVSTQHHWALS